MPENRTYTEADVRELRKEWEAVRDQQDLVKQMAKFEGLLAALPVQMEAIARRVVVEVLAEQRVKAAERTWSRAPVFAQVAQLLIALTLGVAGYFVGKGHLPP